MSIAEDAWNHYLQVGNIALEAARRAAKLAATRVEDLSQQAEDSFIAACEESSTKSRDADIAYHEFREKARADGYN